VHFAKVGDKVVAAAPQPRLQELIARATQSSDASPGAIADPALRQSLQGHAVSAVLDLRRLAEAVKALPSETWGIGGFAYKATTARWLDAANDLRAVTLSMDSKQGAVQAELNLRLQKQ
jgi:hypothetical protein